MDLLLSNFIVIIIIKHRYNNDRGSKVNGQGADTVHAPQEKFSSFRISKINFDSLYALFMNARNHL